MPEKVWQVPFPCLYCNVKPRKQVAIAVDCQGRFLSLPLLHKYVQLVFSHRLFDWFCSLLEPFLNKVVISLYPTGDDWANCSHDSRNYNDFGVQGKEASSIVFKWISSFPKRNNKSLNVYFSWRLFARSMQSALSDVMLCSKPLSKRAICGPAVTHCRKSTWIAGKSCCTSISFYHRITLLMCLCTTNPPLQKAWYTDG